MSTMDIVWTVLGLVVVLAVIAFAFWMWRLDRDNFDQGTDTMTDEQRRMNQLGIGLSGGSGAQLGGH